jgi:Leucine-rich repeat (LRR) protein
MAAVKKKATKKKATKKKAASGKSTKKKPLRKVAAKKATAKKATAGKVAMDDLKQAVGGIEKFVTQHDYDAIDTGVELARGLDDPAVFESLLKGCSIDKEGVLVASKLYPVHEDARSYQDYALLHLLLHAPAGARLHRSLQRSNITRLDLFGNQWRELPPGLGTLKKLKKLNFEQIDDALQNADALASCTALTHLTLSNCYGLENLDGLSGCKKLTSLDLRSSRFATLPAGVANCKNLTDLNLSSSTNLESLNGLANSTKLKTLDLPICTSLLSLDGIEKCAQLTSVDLWNCTALENVDGLANCTKLKNLNLEACKRVTPKPPVESMTTRKEVATYQGLLKE